MNKKYFVALLAISAAIVGVVGFLMLIDDGPSVVTVDERARPGIEKTDVDSVSAGAGDRLQSESNSVGSRMKSPFDQLGISLKELDFKLALQSLDESLVEEIARIGDFYEDKAKLIEARLARIEADDVGKYTIVVPAFYESGGRQLEYEYLKQLQGLTDDPYKGDVVLAKALKDRRIRQLSFGYGEKRIELDFTNRTEHYAFVAWDVRVATSTSPIGTKLNFPLSNFKDNKEIEHLRFLIPEHELKEPPASRGKD